MHGSALLNRRRGLVFALHVAFIPSDVCGACFVTSCSLLNIERHAGNCCFCTTRIQTVVHQGCLVELTVRVRFPCSVLPAVVDAVFKASVLLLSLDYGLSIFKVCTVFGVYNGTYMFLISINQLSQPFLSAHVSL